jgi:hypothetical protein
MLSFRLTNICNVWVLLVSPNNRPQTTPNNHKHPQTGTPKTHKQVPQKPTNRYPKHPQTTQTPTNYPKQPQTPTNYPKLPQTPTNNEKHAAADCVLRPPGLPNSKRMRLCLRLYFYVTVGMCTCSALMPWTRAIICH